MNWIGIGSGKGLLPIWHPAIPWTNVDLFSIGLTGTNFSKIWIGGNAFENVICKMLFILPWPQCVKDISKVPHCFHDLWWVCNLYHTSWPLIAWEQGTISIWRCKPSSDVTPIIKIRQSHDHLAFIMGIIWLEGWSLYQNRSLFTTVDDTELALILAQCSVLLPLGWGPTQCSVCCH